MNAENKVHQAIAMIPVESSQIAAVGHDLDTNTLAIQFTAKSGTGSVYHYSNFTAEDFAEFMGAESLGSHFGKVIKPNADRFPYVKIDAAAEVPADTNLFITVPEVTLPNSTVVPSFRVGQFACSKGADGKAAITAEVTPWVNINYADSKAACKAIGAEMITELQWLAIAHDVANQDCNWTGGKVGEGDLFQGLRYWTVSSAQPGTFVSSDETEQRWLTLSNGERICDVNGNIYQWVHDNVQGDANGIIARDFAEDSPSITTPQFPSEENGMGNYGVWDWSGDALVRGGCWFSESSAGVFRLISGWPGSEHDNVGFRCTKSL
jgi:formylglycine-generating enzyme required for sulfatase activity